MLTVDEIIFAIKNLSKDEYKRVRQWFSEYDWQAWDEQIEADSKAGKLDFLIKDAQNSKKYGKLGDI